MLSGTEASVLMLWGIIGGRSLQTEQSSESVSELRLSDCSDDEREREMLEAAGPPPRLATIALMGSVLQ